jgi:hypothetical protein
VSEYTSAERAAACVGLVVAAALFLVSLDVATGGRLSAGARGRYAWNAATDPGEEELSR